MRGWCPQVHRGSFAAAIRNGFAKSASVIPLNHGLGSAVTDHVVVAEQPQCCISSTALKGKGKRPIILPASRYRLFDYASADWITLPIFRNLPGQWSSQRGAFTKYQFSPLIKNDQYTDTMITYELNSAISCFSTWRETSSKRIMVIRKCTPSLRTRQPDLCWFQ